MGTDHNKVKAVVAGEIFIRMLTAFIQQAKKNGVTEIKRAVNHVPNKDLLEYLCFTKACNDKGITLVSELEKLEFAEKLHLAAQYYRRFGEVAKIKKDKGSNGDI